MGGMIADACGLEGDERQEYMIKFANNDTIQNLAGTIFL